MIFKRRIQKLNREKKDIEREMQELVRLYGVNLKKRTYIVDKVSKNNDKINRMGHTMDGMLDIRLEVKETLVNETTKEKDQIDEDNYNVTDVIKYHKKTVADLNSVIKESQILQKDHFGKSKEQIGQESNRKRAFIKLLHLVSEDRYRELAENYGFIDDLYDNSDYVPSLAIMNVKEKQSNSNKQDVIINSLRALDMTNLGLEIYMDSISSEELTEVTSKFIMMFTNARQYNSNIQDQLVSLLNHKTYKMEKVIDLEKELLLQKDTEGVHLEQYKESPIFQYLSWYEKDLFDHLEALQSQNHIIMNHIYDTNNSMIKVYSQLLLLYIKVCLFRKKATPNNQIVDGDLNSYLAAEDLLGHMNVSDTKVLASYTIYGNVYKFIPTKNKFRLNLNESIVGICLMKSLFKGHISRLTEDMYFATVNSTQAKKLPNRKFDRFIDKMFRDEHNLEIESSKVLIDWLLRKVG